MATAMSPFRFVVLLLLSYIWQVDSIMSGLCALESQQPVNYSQAREDCKTRNGSLLAPADLIISNPSLQLYLSSFLNDSSWTFWFTTNDTPCKIANRSGHHVAACTEHHYYFCIFYKEDSNASQCSVKLHIPTTSVTLLTTTAPTTPPATDYPVDSPNTTITILSVYMICVVIIVVGGILVVKMRHCRNKEEDVYYSPFRFQPQLPMLRGVDYPRYYRRACQYNQSRRIRNLSCVEELLEHNATGSSSNIEDDSEQCKTVANVDDEMVYEPFDFHADRHERSCPLTPEHYTPLLNPGETPESALFFGRRFDFDRVGGPSAENLENPFYEPLSATTRL